MVGGIAIQHVDHAQPAQVVAHLAQPGAPGGLGFPHRAEEALGHALRAGIDHRVHGGATAHYFFVWQQGLVDELDCPIDPHHGFPTCRHCRKGMGVP